MNGPHVLIVHPGAVPDMALLHAIAGRCGHLVVVADQMPPPTRDALSYVPEMLKFQPVRIEDFDLDLPVEKKPVRPSGRGNRRQRQRRASAFEAMHTKYCP